MRYDVCVVGGCGHVGLPLAICFAHEGKNVVIYDINEEALAVVAAGKMPFHEDGAEERLADALSSGRISLSSKPDAISESANVILIMGTPVDSHLNPSFSDIVKTVRKHLSNFRNGQLLVLRSTVYPGTADRIYRLIEDAGLKVEVAFCPERIAEGQAIRETYELPQIVSAFTPEGMRKAHELFATFTDDVIELEPIEAEVAKLFTNTWRYLRFAIANQFYSIANDHGIDFYKIHKAITHNYPRTRDLPTAGFAAGPCLFKDTMQLGAFSQNKFFLGHAAMLVNEGQPAYIVECLKNRFDLSETVAGVLGMAFKANSDDGRESLAYKLRKVLEIECKEVLITDPYVQDERILPVEEVIRRSDVLIVAAPHAVYKDLDLKGKHVVDIWNFYGNGGLI